MNEGNEDLEKNKQEKEIVILEHISSDYVQLLDSDIESEIYDLQPKDLKRFSDYISKSFFEQFGIEVEIEFVKETSTDKETVAIIKVHLKAKELPEGVRLEELRLFKISKDDDIHDGHYYISYDTKGKAELGGIYGDAVWLGAKGLKYEHENKYLGRKTEFMVQNSLRHHLNQSGGKNCWEMEILTKDMKRKGYLEVFENPSDNVAENTCRELVRRAGAYIVGQLKMRTKEL